MRRYAFPLIVFFVLLTLLASAAGPVSAANPARSVVRHMTLEYYAKPTPPSPGGGSKVYDYYLLIGPKWDLGQYPGGVPYEICRDRLPSGADAQIMAAFESWDAATEKELFRDTPSYSDNSGTLGDLINNISWEFMPDPMSSAIAVSWISYNDVDSSGGPSTGDEMLEVDIMFNAALSWGIDADGEGKAYTLRRAYDIRNVAAHEIGHMVGLDDLYARAYSELTMYGYGSKAETKKISLEAGDINGAKALYKN